MKVWCQSCGSFGTDPIWDAYEAALKNRASEVVRPGTEICLYGLSATVPGIDKYKASQNLCALQSIKNALIAEDEGYDAFVMISTLDSGIHEIKETLQIPSVFLLENSLHFATMFSRRFAFLTHNKQFLKQLTDQTRQYGLAANMVQGVHLDLSYNDWPVIYDNPNQFIDSVVDKAKEAINSGAEILIVGALPLNIWLFEQKIENINGCPVLDSFGCALKVAELMIDMKNLGIANSGNFIKDKKIRESIKKIYFQ